MKADYFFSDTEGFIVSEVFADTEYAWDALKNTQKILLPLLKGKRERGGRSRGKTNFYGNYSIGRDTLVHNDVTILGPVVIGENCTIMPGALIRPGTIIGNNCTIGHGCEVKNSIIMDGAKIQSLTFVGDSVIGKSARIGSGVITANRMFDQSNVVVKTEDGSRTDTELEFFGCVLGDHSRVGASCVTQPGALIGKFCWIYPMTSVRGFIPEAKRVFHQAPLVLRENRRVELKK